MYIVGAMTKELGYRVLLNSVSNTNVRILTLIKKMTVALPSQIVGVIPRVGYINGYGWADETVVLVDLSSDSVPTFTQMVQRSRSHL